MAAAKDCTFCRIVGDGEAAPTVFEDEDVVAFLDHRPLFPGHCLVVPRAHHETLADLPAPAVAPLFMGARLLSRAVVDAMDAEGSFVAVNNTVSQSVPHLHVHVVPRRKGDGLRGFFWPRQPYDGPQAMAETRRRLRAAIDRLRSEGFP
ncbi:MAG TPA: HIT family protein [Vicinamibacteria bacterium]|nr:HIT family protein [Vicinamibacteria bacterium]